MIQWLQRRQLDVLRTGTFWWGVVLASWFIYLLFNRSPDWISPPGPLQWPERYWAFWLAAVALSAVTFALHWFSLRGADDATKVSPRRGLFYLVVGVDGRVSTSKVQVILWTYAIAFVFVAVILRGDAGSIPTALEPQYFLLLGIPVVGAAGASLITTQKLEQGNISKVAVEETAPVTPPTSSPDSAPGPLTGLGQLVSDDQGRGDIGDFQYFIFNVVGLVYFFVALLAVADIVLPVLPDTLVALTGASALAYLTKKGVVNDTPLITAITPTRVAPGESIEIRGQHFMINGSSSVPAGQPAVLIDGRLASVAKAQPTTITATVPNDVPEGDVEVQVRTAGGLETETRDLKIHTPVPVMLSFHPNRVSKGQQAQISIHGRGFQGGAATGSPSVTLGGLDLTLITDSDTLLTARVDQAVSQALDVGEHDLAVRNRAGNPASSPARVTIGP